MESEKQKKKNASIITAIGISLLIHLAAGMVLIFGLSDNTISPPKLNGVNLVWITLDAVNKNPKAEIQNTTAAQQPSAGQKSVINQPDTENPVYRQVSEQIYAAVPKESANAIKPMVFEASGKGAKDSTDNTAGSRGTKNTVDDTSAAEAVVAYPLYKENAPPAYPAIARARGYEGVVLVFAEILPNGRVGEIKIRKSSGYAILDQSAVQAVKPWRFEPAKKSGNPFTAWVELPIKFILNNKGSQS